MRALTPTPTATAAVVACLLSSNAAAETCADEACSLVAAGFVDAQVYAPIAGFSADGDEILFGLSQVELDLGFYKEGLEIRTDLNAHVDGDLTSANDIVEQAYADITLAEALYLRVGKQNALYGWDEVDPVDPLRAPADREEDHAEQLYFGWSQIPTLSNLTGVFLTAVVGTATLHVWASNGDDRVIEDRPATPRSVTPGLRVEVEPCENLGVAATTTVSGLATGADPYWMADADAWLTPGGGDTMVFAELNVGLVSSDVASLAGLAGVTHPVSAATSFTLRVDYLDRDVPSAPDNDAAEQLGVAVAALVRPGGTGQVVGEHLRLVAELGALRARDADVALAAALQLTAHW